MKRLNGTTIDHMLLRDYFASRAPVDIPRWFEATDPNFVMPKGVTANDVESPEQRSIVEAWIEDPIYDLPSELQWFSDAVQAYDDAVIQRQEADQKARYFAWRWYYAEQMMIARESALKG